MATKTYTNFLALLMFNRVCNKQSLTLMCGGQRNGSYYKTKALREGHIKETRIVKRERVKHIYITYSLTKAGFLYLLTHDKNITYLLPSDDSVYLSTIKKADYNNERRIRIARDNEALTMAAAAGASISFQNYTASIRNIPQEDDDLNGELCVEDYIKGNLTDEVFKKLALYENCSADNADFVFYNGTFFKSKAGGANDYVSVRDYLAGRYNGVVDSRFKSLLVFTAPMFGMGWFKWVVEKEINALNIWKKTSSITAAEYRFQRGPSAALIVQSAKQFSNLYFDVDKAKRESNEEFGGDFRELYILPLNEDGAKQLRWLMLTDDEEFNRQTIEDAVLSGAYSENNGANKSLFPLLNEFHQRTALGFQLDAKKMLRIEHAAKSLPHETFEIICQPWQENYYRAVMPENVTIKLIDLE